MSVSRKQLADYLRRLLRAAPAGDVFYSRPEISADDSFAAIQAAERSRRDITVGNDHRRVLPIVTLSGELVGLVTAIDQQAQAVACDVQTLDGDPSSWQLKFADDLSALIIC